MSATSALDTYDRLTGPNSVASRVQRLVDGQTNVHVRSALRLQEEQERRRQRQFRTLADAVAGPAVRNRALADTKIGRVSALDGMKLGGVGALGEMKGISSVADSVLGQRLAHGATRGALKPWEMSTRRLVRDAQSLLRPLKIGAVAPLSSSERYELRRVERDLVHVRKYGLAELTGVGQSRVDALLKQTRDALRLDVTTPRVSFAYAMPTAAVTSLVNKSWVNAHRNAALAAYSPLAWPRPGFPSGIASAVSASERMWSPAAYAAASPAETYFPVERAEDDLADDALSPATQVAIDVAVMVAGVMATVSAEIQDRAATAHALKDLLLVRMREAAGEVAATAAEHGADGVEWGRTEPGWAFHVMWELRDVLTTKERRDWTAAVLAWAVAVLAWGTNIAVHFAFTNTTASAFVGFSLWVSTMALFNKAIDACEAHDRRDLIPSHIRSS